MGPLKLNKRSYDVELPSVAAGLQATETKLQNEDMRLPILKCRHIVGFVGFCCFFFATIARINMSISLVAMVNHSAVAQRAVIKSDSCSLFMPNSTQTEEVEYNEDGEFLWSPEIQGYILSFYSLGYAISQIPAGRLVDIYGCKWSLFLSVLITSVGTFLTPMFAWISPEAFTALQFIRGLSQGVLLPAASVLVSKWFRTSEMGQMYAFMMSGSSVSCIVGSFLTGYLCASSGKWPSSYYATGAIGAVLSILLLFCVYESPSVHPRIAKAELNFILEGQEEKGTNTKNSLGKKNPNVPWRKIFTSVPVYVLLYSSFGQGWAQSQFLTVHPIYLGIILHYPIAKNGMFTALTFVIQFVFIQVAVIGASFMIQKKIAGNTFTRKFWNFIACFGISASMLGIYLSGCNRNLSAIFAMLSTGFVGTGFAGCIASVSQMAPEFAGLLTGLNVVLNVLPFVFLPMIVGFLTDEQQTIEQWNKVFFMVITLVMSSGIVYCIFGSAEVQPWNFLEEEKDDKKTDSETRF